MKYTWEKKICPFGKMFHRISLTNYNRKQYTSHCYRQIYLVSVQEQRQGKKRTQEKSWISTCCEVVTAIYAKLLLHL